jgi:hypothetical protein
VSCILIRTYIPAILRTVMSITIGIKKTTGESFSVSLPASDTTLVDELRAQVAAAAGIPPQEIKLIFRGKVLKDGTTLALYNVTDGVVVHLMKQQPAAAGAAPAQETPATASAAPSAPQQHQQQPLNIPPQAQVFQMSFPPGMPPSTFSPCAPSLLLLLPSRLPQAWCPWAMS